MANGVQISGLPVAASLESGDLMVLQRGNTAMQVPEQTLIKALTAAADGHGGIQRVYKSKTSGLVDTYLIVYADGNTGTFTVTNGADGAAGAKGDKGDPGEKGDPGTAEKLTDKQVLYGASSSGTTAPTSWLSSPPQVAAGAYLWTRTKLTFLTGDVQFYTVARQGVDGSGGSGGGTVTSVNNIGPDSEGNINLAAENITYTDGKNLYQAVYAKQDQITATGLLKRGADGNIVAAVQGTDYAAASVAQSVALKKSARKDQYSSTQKVWTSRWEITGLPVTKSSHVIVTPEPSYVSVWSKSGFAASDITTDGTMVFFCDYDSRPDLDVYARILVL